MMGLEHVADPVLIACHAQGQLFVTAATKLEVLADLDLLKLNRGWARRTWDRDVLEHAGIVGCWVWTGCIDLVVRF